MDSGLVLWWLRTCWTLCTDTVDTVERLILITYYCCHGNRSYRRAHLIPLRRFLEAALQADLRDFFAETCFEVSSIALFVGLLTCVCHLLYEHFGRLCYGGQHGFQWYDTVWQVYFARENFRKIHSSGWFVLWWFYCRNQPGIGVRLQYLVVTLLLISNTLILSCPSWIPYIRKFLLLKKIFVVVSNHENYMHEQRNTLTVFLIQGVCCCPQYHPGQLLQQVKKWEKPSVLHLVGNVGHMGSITVWAEIGKHASHHSVTAPVAASQILW